MKKLIFSLVMITTLSASAQEDVNNLLLKDYRPKSIYHTPQTHIEKSMFPVIDMHAHPYPETSEDLDLWIKTMDAVGLQKSIILTYSYGHRFDSLVNVFGKYPDRFDLWCGIDYSKYGTSEFPESAVKELRRCYEKGARGVGELGDKGKGLYYSKPPAYGLHPDDDQMKPIFKVCAELNMPVNLHVADPKWMYETMDRFNDGLMNAYKWRLDDQEGIVDHAGMIRILENTLKKNPNTTFVACHLANCSYDLNLIANLLDQYPNLYIDISARYAELTPVPRTTRKFFITYQDRILYGTDMGQSQDMYQLTFRILETDDEHFYAHKHSSYHWAMNGLDLPEQVLEKIYNLNASAIIANQTK